MAPIAGHDCNVAARGQSAGTRPSSTAALISACVGMRHPFTGADPNALTDARVGIIKAALQLTPDREKYWPAVEEAIRPSAKNHRC